MQRRIEGCAILGHTLEDGGGLEGWTVGVAHLRELLDDRIDPEAVRIAKRTAQEGREADAEHGANIAVSRAGDDSLFQAACCLVDEGESKTALDEVSREALRR